MIKKQIAAIICLSFLFAPVFAAQVAILQTDTRQEAWAKETLNNSDLQTNIDGKLATSGDGSSLTGLQFDQFITQTAWRVFYSNTDGDVTELALGADGTYLKSNGAAAAPTFETPSGTSPLTTKGDIYSYSTVDARLPVGANSAMLAADSTETTGLKWITQLTLQFGQYLEFEGATANESELTLDAGDPAEDRTMVLTNIASDALEFVIDGGGSAITTGVKGFLEIPWACTINSATLLADQSGSIVIDVWVDTYANYPPTDADSITAAAPPTITTAVKSQDTTLTSWTLSLSKGDIIGFNVDSITTVEKVTISLKVDK